ncbi:MAG: PilZ domain-containing protein [Desulfofustis sp.]|nr:PilZ domain-containing protein [Desulfofustis sp.]
MKKLDERRAAFRMDVVSRAICRLKSETVMTSGPIRDISIAGLYLETTAKPAVGTRVGVEIVLSGKHSEMVIGAMTAVIVRHDANGLAIRFDERFEWFAMVPLYFHTPPAPPL